MKGKKHTKSKANMASMYRKMHGTGVKKKKATKKRKMGY